MVAPCPMSLLAELEESKGRPASYKYVAPNGAGGISKLQLQQFPTQLHNLGILTQILANLGTHAKRSAPGGGTGSCHSRRGYRRFKSSPSTGKNACTYLQSAIRQRTYETEY